MTYIKFTKHFEMLLNGICNQQYKKNYFNAIVLPYAHNYPDYISQWVDSDKGKELMVKHASHIWEIM